MAGNGPVNVILYDGEKFIILTAGTRIPLMERSDLFEEFGNY